MIKYTFNCRILILCYIINRMSENKYANAYIYTIQHRINKDLVYVGSSALPIDLRYSLHKSDCKSSKNVSLYNHIDNDDWSDWYIDVYEFFPCNSRSELCKREGEVTREIATINKNIAGRTMKEYYEDNADQKREYQREYNKNNIEKIRKYGREYYNDNIEKRRKYGREYYYQKRSATP